VEEIYLEEGFGMTLAMQAMGRADDGGRALVARAMSASLPRLRHFELLGPSLISGSESLAVAKAAIENWPLLETFGLSSIRLDSGEALALAQALGSTSRLTRLKKLNLSRTRLGYEAVSILLGGGAAWLDTLEVLDLANNVSADDDKLAQVMIRAAPRLPSLTAFIMDGDNVKSKTFEKIERDFPHVNVHLAY
jgi:hypothetical protein